MRADINRKEGVVSLVPETFEDLWHIYKLITPGAIVKAHSTRKFKPAGSGREERISVTVVLEAEKAELHRHASKLRITGKIVEIRPEEIAPLGSYHTIDIGTGEQVKIRKEWKPFEFDAVKAAVETSKRCTVHFVMVDYDRALFASLRQYGVDFGVELENRAGKKDKNVETGKFFEDIICLLERMDGTVIIAGPGFAKDNLYALIKSRKPGLANRVKVMSASNNERSGVYEILKSEEMHRIMEEEQMHTIFRHLEAFLRNIGKGNGLAAYGKDELEKAAANGAIEVLVVVDTLVRSDAFYEELLDMVKSKGGEIRIVPEESQAAEQVKAFGGAIAVLKYRIL